MKLFVKIIVIAVVGGWFFSSCVAPSPNSSATDKTLRIATSYKIQSLAPHDSASYFLVEYGVSETPLTIDDAAQIKPNLLESYTPVDERNWRLVVRENLSFHNGKPVTAAAFAAAMNFQLKNSAETKSLLSGASVAATNGRELVLTTDAPNAGVPAALADESGFPIFDVECVEQANRDNEKMIAGGCYTGAYQPVSLDDREMRLESSPNYWQGAPPLDGIVVKFVPDAQTRILAVQSNEADIALYPPAETGRTLANQTNAFFVTGANSTNGPRLFFNTRRPPFNDANIRRVAAFGIKYESLAEEIFDGVFQTADGFFPPVFPFAVANQKTDIEEAKRLLDEADWTVNENGVRQKNGGDLYAVLLTYPQQPDWVILATAIQANLREIGFDVKIRQVEDINAAFRAGDWDFGIISPGITTYGGAPEPLLREFLSSGGEKNYVGARDEELDRLIEDLSRTFDERKRSELLQRIQQIVIAEKAYEARPVFSRPRAVVGRRYRNYKPSPYLRHVTFATKPD